MGAVLSGYASRQDANAGMPVDGLTAAYQRILSGLAVAFIFWLTARGRRMRRLIPDAEAAESENEAVLSPADHGSGLLPQPSVRPWIVANALAGPAFGVGCYQWALMTEKSGVVLPIVALTPLVIIPFSRYVEGERPRKHSLLGGIVAVAGVFALTGGVQFLQHWIGR
jgi:drug/metabolite transporter (DMT)-like permease